MEKYTWNFDKDAEMWRNDEFDTIEECVAEAEKENPEAEVVYIGEIVPFDFVVDSTDVLERLEEKASDFSDIGHDWDAFSLKEKDELDELDEKLTIVVKEWMKKYGYTPTFYIVTNVSEHRLKWGDTPCKN